jgi:hypothetical protein
MKPPRQIGLALIHFAELPAVRLFVALSLLVSGMDDLLDEWSGTEGVFNLDVYHGVTVFALQQVVRSLGSLLDGLHVAGRNTAAVLSPGHQVFNPGNPGQVVVDHGDHQRHQQHESHK